MVVDRIEDVTNPEEIHGKPKCERKVALYGWVRGIATYCFFIFSHTRIA